MPGWSPTPLLFKFVWCPPPDGFVEVVESVREFAVQATLEPRKYQATVGHISPTCGQDSQGSRREMGDLFFEHPCPPPPPPTAVICLSPPWSLLTRRDGVLSVGDSSFRLGRVFNVSYSPPTFSLLPHRAANGPGPRGMQVPKFREMVASLCQVIRLRLFLIITIENVTGGLGLFFHACLRALSCTASSSKHIYGKSIGTSWPTCQLSLVCVPSPHQGFSKWEARGRRLGLSLRTQRARLDTMARSSSI